MTVSRLIILRMKNVSTKICRENQNTQFMFRNFFSENRDVYKTMSKNEVETERTQMTIWRRVACRISKAARARTHTHTHTEIYNTDCFSTLTMVSSTRLKITLYVHCLHACFNRTPNRQHSYQHGTSAHQFLHHDFLLNTF
jgi:hypothetical protein